MNSNHNLNLNSNVNSTNHLIDSSFGFGSKNQYTFSNTSAINKKFNNTDNLINDKTSLLLEHKAGSNKENENENICGEDDGKLIN